MGATNFYCEANGETISDAFRQAVDNACWQYGHQGYTGSIAEKMGFTEFRIPLDCLPEIVDESVRHWSFAMRVDGAMCFLSDCYGDSDIEEALAREETSEWSRQAQVDALALRKALGNNEFRRMVDTWGDKWGHAVAFRITDGMYAFCGLASC